MITREKIIELIESTQCGIGKPQVTSATGQLANAILAAIEHDGQVLTTDGEYVRDGDNAWTLSKNEKQIAISRVRVIILVTKQTPRIAYPDETWDYIDDRSLLFAHYPNAIAKINELMGQTIAIVNADEAPAVDPDAGKWVIGGPGNTYYLLGKGWRVDPGNATFFTNENSAKSFIKHLSCTFVKAMPLSEARKIEAKRLEGGGK